MTMTKPKRNMIVWTHEICYCKYESGFTVQSVHSSRTLAFRALLAAKRQSVEAHLRLRQCYGKRRGELYDVAPDFDAQAVRGYTVDGDELPNPLVIYVRGRDW
jgi:hypothetical protein